MNDMDVAAAEPEACSEDLQRECVSNDRVTRDRKRLRSDVAEVSKLEQCLRPLLEHSGFGGEDVFAVQLIIAESLTNAIEHGNDSDPGKLVTVDYEISAHRFWLRVEDQGIGFDFCRRPDRLSPDGVAIVGGRGLHLIDHYASEVCYVFPGNCVVIEYRPKGD